MKQRLLAATALLALLTPLKADMYLQCIPGSNDRLDEANRDRNNGNRLFDSQNNDRGGYNVGKMSYFFNEQVPVCWTNQHSSGRFGLRGTEIKFQYMCDSLARDGTTTNTIPDDPRQCYNYDCDTDTEYGRHESFSFYQYCKATERNYGLFTANQNLKGKASIYTRQNPNGNRHAYECPEERDYYPWWRGSPWRDIHIFTNNAERCAAYQTESQNVKSRWQCVFTRQYWDDVLQGYVRGQHYGMLSLNMTKCAASPTFVSPRDNQTYKIYQPEEVPSHGIDAPTCSEAMVTRDNHHGLPGTRNYWTYMWTVPDLSDDDIYTEADYGSCCVLRTTYNITTNDYPAWIDDFGIESGVNRLNNSVRNNPDPDVDPAEIYIWERFGLTREEVNIAFTNRDRDSTEQKQGRGYVFVNNPRVDPFDLTVNDNGDQVRVQLQLAINTNQFGRTFQDRTHCFSIHSRPSNIPNSAKISLLTVQGKRGNIVQVYPATEYTFQPEPAQITRGDYVHFCWTGSNTNPHNNDGQGLAGTDRSNICPSNDQQYSKELYSNSDGNYDKLGDYRGPGYNKDSDSSNKIDNTNYMSSGPAVGDIGTDYPAWLQVPAYSSRLPKWYPYAQRRQVTKSAMGGLDIDTLSRLCTTRKIEKDYRQIDFGSMDQMDDAGTTTCLEPMKVTENGEWNFLSTRNNNFSNRSQKGTLIVSDSDTFVASVTEKGGRFTNGPGNAIVVVPPGAVVEGQSLQFSVTTWYKPGSDSSIVQLAGPDGGVFNSNELVEGGYLEIWVPYNAKGLNQPTIYHTDDVQSSSSWSDSGEARIDYSQNTYYAVKDVNSGGYYKAVNSASWWQVLLLVAFGGLVFACIGFIIVKKCYLKN